MMAADENPKTDEKHPIGADLVIPVCAVAFTIYYFWTIIDAPWTAKVTTIFIGTILIALCVLLFIRAGFSLKRGDATLSLRFLIEPVEALPRRIGLFALTLGYIIALPWVGFTLTTFAFLSLGMLLLSRGEGKRFKIILSAVLSVGWFLLFVVAFKRQFPLGWFDETFKALLKSMGVG